LFSREIVGHAADYIDDDEYDDDEVESVAVSGGAVDDGPPIDDAPTEARVDARTALMDLDPEVRAEGEPPALGGAEALLGIVVLAVTAVLVNATPRGHRERGGNEVRPAPMRSNQVVIDVTIVRARPQRRPRAPSPRRSTDDVAEPWSPTSRAATSLINVLLRKLGPGTTCRRASTSRSRATGAPPERSCSSTSTK
jgi:hypothetical protein